MPSRRTWPAAVVDAFAFDRADGGDLHVGQRRAGGSLTVMVSTAVAVDGAAGRGRGAAWPGRVVARAPGRRSLRQRDAGVHSTVRSAAVALMSLLLLSPPPRWPSAGLEVDGPRE